MRAFVVGLLCVGLAGCRKKPPVVVVTPPPPPVQTPKHTSKQVRKRRPAVAAAQPVPVPMGEFVDPSDRPRILAEIDSNLRDASARLPAARASLTLETIRQIEALLVQAQDARAKNQLLTAQRLSARALALTQ